MTKNSDALLIVDDLLSEINGNGSMISDGIPFNEYVEVQLMILFDLLKGHDIEDSSIVQLRNQRNKINRMISTLKKETLKQ